MSEHYVVEQTTPKWVNTFLVTLGGVLASSLLLWIARSQLDINTNQAVILNKLETQSELMSSNQVATEARIANLLDNQNRIWPRLRAHGENIQLLTREFEQICDCDISLKEPDAY